MEKRKARNYPRRVFSTTVTYTNGNAETHEGAKAVSVNISRSGVCLYTCHFHEEGAVIHFKAGVPFHIEGLATVRWVRKLYDGLYRVGCEFEELKTI